MSSEQPPAGQALGNVGILDIREATEEALSGIGARRHRQAPPAPERCNLLQARAVFYEGELWHIEEESEGKDELPSRFEWLDGKATLLCAETCGSQPTSIPGSSPTACTRSNLGRIVCTPEQMGALQARLGLDEGQLRARAAGDRAKGPEAKGERDGIQNVGYLRL